MKAQSIPFLIVAGSLLAASCQKAPPKTSPEVVARAAASIPDDPNDPAWQEAPEHAAKLVLQDLVEPRLLQASTAEVRVRSITDGQRIAFRLEWADTSKNDLPKAAHFSDACAVQLPAAVEPNVPAPQMGEAGRGVEITYWRASWQAAVDGRGHSIRDIYPRASIDHYPFEAASLAEGSPEKEAMEKRYAPALALGNAMAGPRATPVEDLIAEGPGTLTRAESQSSAGRGRHSGTLWSVVIARRMPPGVSPGGRTNVAFAVWEGGHQETGARKMRTGWVPLLVEGRP